MKDASLPGLLCTLAAVTGAVDAVGFLGLGHVFVANMIGALALDGGLALGALLVLNVGVAASLVLAIALPATSGCFAHRLRA